MSQVVNMYGFYMLRDVLEDFQHSFDRYLLTLLHQTGIPAAFAYLGRQWDALEEAMPEIMFPVVLLNVLARWAFMEFTASYWIGFGHALVLYYGITTLQWVWRLRRTPHAERRTR